MPKLVYTAAKGIVESRDALSGFQINDVPLKPGITSAVTYTGGLYTIVFTTAHNGGGGAGEDYDEKYFCIENRDGLKFGFWFDKNTSTIPTALTDLSNTEDNEVQLGSDANKTQTEIGDLLVTAINSTSTEAKKYFFAKNSSGTVTIHVLQTGMMEKNAGSDAVSGNLTDITDNTIVLTSAGAGQGATRVTESRAIPAVPMVQQTVTIGTASDVASVKSQIALSDGSVAGEEKFIQFAAPSAGQLILTGNFLHGTTTGTKVTFTAAQGAANGILFLWTSTAWMIVNKQANMAVS